MPLLQRLNVPGWLIILTVMSSMPMMARAAVPDTPWSSPDSVSATPAIAPLAVVPASTSCASLADTDLTGIGGEGSGVTSAEETTSDGQASCQVKGTLGKYTHFQVNLPTSTWSQRYLQVGCGGLCGQITLNAGASDSCVPLENNGFVMAATDMGSSSDGTFGQTPERRHDFAYRAQHRTAVAAKALIKDYYGQAQKYAYFDGCSDGGREALVAAQRFPDDFDGIIAGAPAMSFLVQNGIYHAWQARTNTDTSGNPILTADKLPLIHRAVLAQCDGLDGQVDGLISAPGLCHFDPASLKCPANAGDKSQCLTPAEVTVVHRFYEGPIDSKTDLHLTLGGPMPGSELEWSGVYVSEPEGRPLASRMISLSALRNVIFKKNPGESMTLDDMSFDLSTFKKVTALHTLYDATSPDLSAFKASGGRLILWQGWNDPHISPAYLIAYHEAIAKTMGKHQAAEFERLYMLPGVAHCSGGEGPDRIDLLTPMMSWVERDQAPDAINTFAVSGGQGDDFGQPTGDTPGAQPADAETSQEKPADTAGNEENSANASITQKLVTESRPVYPYPYIARYDGKGDPRSASSYTRGKPLEQLTFSPWAGDTLFKPYQGVVTDQAR